MKKHSFDPLIKAEDDGLIIPTVRSWSREKYGLLGTYGNVFTTSMRNKWNQLVYIDLFSGAGFSRIEESGPILYSSALIALSLPHPFTKYILCEENPAKFEALKTRCTKLFPNRDIEFINGDSNKSISKIKSAIPPFGRGNTLLSFCFVDPFSLNLEFQTIKELGQSRNIDFLVLLALHMDANRNLKAYLAKESNKIELFLNNPDWKAEYTTRFLKSGESFVRFLSDSYNENMKRLGYIIEPNQMEQIRSDDRNLPLYYLAFYSKHNLGNKFWEEIKVYRNRQFKFDF